MTLHPLLLALLLTAAAQPAPQRVAIPNASFEQTQDPKPGKYACCFAKWLFATRVGSCALSAVERKDGSAAARIECKDGPARADLLGPFMKLPAFTEFSVEVDVRRRGAVGVVALHPPFDRRQVDLALAAGPEGEWRRFKTTLRTGAASKYYRVTLAAAGAGWVEYDNLSLKQVRTIGRPQRTAYIVDLNEREEGYTPPEKFWFKHDLESVWGYRVVVDPYSKVTRDRLKELDPACVILTPKLMKKFPPGDRAARRAASARASQAIADAGLRVLGICLGHQWLGRRAGQRIVRGEERGYFEVTTAANDPIFAGLPTAFPLSESHGWVVR